MGISHCAAEETGSRKLRLWMGLILKPEFHASEMEYRSRVVGKEEVADPGHTVLRGWVMDQ